MRILFLLLLPLGLMAQPSNESSSGSAKAMAFVKSLNEAQQKKAVFAFENMNRYEWHFLPAAMVARTGIAVKDLDSLQKEHVHHLLQSYLSKEGYTRSKNIMDFEYLLKEMQPTNANRIPENYSISIYGTPSQDSIWGFKFSGHHLALNFTIVKDKIGFAPFFFGAYPAEVKEGAKKGTRLLKDQEDFGFDLIHSLTAEQKEKAIFQLKAFTEVVTTNSQKVGPMEPVGIFASAMNPAQKIILNKVIAAYLLSMPNALANARIKRIATEDMNTIRFGWGGETEPGKPHYYRIQGKTFLIEFDNTQDNANHVHTVWRDFNGDFGADLLREHYHNSKHHL
jgi:Protein of unknown function (DUF3500)